jgi:putative PIN family toxin of toxin-antitoxin system
MIIPRVVLDTNVVFAALKSSSGASAHLLRCALDGEIELWVSELLWEEYCGVLRRSTAILGCDAATVERFLDVLAGLVTLQEIYFVWRPHLRDVADDKVLECAVAARAEWLVTFNGRDFVGSDRFQVRIVTSGEMLEILSRIQAETEGETPHEIQPDPSTTEGKSEEEK